MSRLAVLVLVLVALVVVYARLLVPNHPEDLVDAPLAMAPTGSPEPPIHSPGCRTTWERSHRFDDQLPPDGPATVGGVRLPRGSRCQGYWATDGPVSAPIAVAKQLGAKFPQTGLWPLIWDDLGDPDELAFPPEDPSIGDGDALGRLRRLYKDFTGSKTLKLKALAAGNPQRDGVDPFDRLAEIWNDYPPRRPDSVIVLVPVRRPSDAVAITGFPGSGEVPPRVLATVARSWEQRFGAVPVTAGLGALGFAVSGPVRRDQAQALALEQSVFAPGSDITVWSEGEPSLAEELAGSADGGDWRTRHFWGFGWPD
jgi:hypothetical protein